MTNPTTADITPETPVAPQGDDTPESVVAKLRAAITETMRSHRLWYLTDEDGLGYPLVDALTPGEGEPITKGVYEIKRLAECAAEAALPFFKAQAAEIARLTLERADTQIKLKSADAKIERMRKTAEGSDQWASDVIAAICKHVGMDDADEGFTADALAQMLDEHSAEFERYRDRATRAEAALATLSAIPESAASVVATLLAGADTSAYATTVTAYADAKREIADMTVKRDAALAQAAMMREALEIIAKGETVVFDADDLGENVITPMGEEEMQGIARNALSTEAAPPAATKTGGTQLADLKKAAVALLIGAEGSEGGEFTVNSNLTDALMSALPGKAQAEIEAAWLDGGIDGDEEEDGDGPSIIKCNPPTAQGGEGGDHAE